MELSSSDFQLPRPWTNIPKLSVERFLPINWDLLPMSSKVYIRFIRKDKRVQVHLVNLAPVSSTSYRPKYGCVVAGDIHSSFQLSVIVSRNRWAFQTQIHDINANTVVGGIKNDIRNWNLGQRSVIYLLSSHVKSTISIWRIPHLERLKHTYFDTTLKAK